MSDEQTQTVSKSVKVIIPPSSGVHVDRSINAGLLFMLRWVKYQRCVLKGLNISQPVIMQMAILDHALKRRKILYLSVPELVNEEGYKYWQLDRQRLSEEFDRLSTRGLLCRSYRDSYNGRGKVLIWGLTGEGKRLMKEYYSYLGGAHDEACWLM